MLCIYADCLRSFIFYVYICQWFPYQQMTLAYTRYLYCNIPWMIRCKQLSEPKMVQFTDTFMRHPWSMSQQANCGYSFVVTYSTGTITFLNLVLSSVLSPSGVPISVTWDCPSFGDSENSSTNFHVIYQSLVQIIITGPPLIYCDSRLRQVPGKFSIQLFHASYFIIITS